MKNTARLLTTFLLCLAAAVPVVVSTPAYATDSFTVIEPFAGGTAGGPSYSTLVADSSGNLYGTTVWGGIVNSHCEYGCGVVYELSPSGASWTETVLYSFTGGSDGLGPVAGLVFDATGNLFGTTSAGGTRGAGTVFELSPGTSGWSKTVIYNFTGGADGSYPESLTFDAAGNLYGAARQGGNANYGVIFELAASGSGWTRHILHSFSGGNDGAYPNVGLVFDASGNLYGTASNGGSTSSSICQTFSGCGVVFELTNTSGGWKETVPHAFTGAADGGGPSGLTIDASGNLYGTAGYGGNTTATACTKLLAPGCGVAFKLTFTTSGWHESILHTFTGGTSGATPEAGATFDSAGNLYVSTVFGGKVNACPYSEGCGTVFELSPTSSGPWTPTLLHRFTNLSDGTAPQGLFVDAAGNIFGASSEGGVQNCSQSGGCGAVFEISPE
jgi:uncharacterized repeat protein (TIGR03803 family)